jgi:hypothetical protein
MIDKKGKICFWHVACSRRTSSIQSLKDKMNFKHVLLAATITAALGSQSAMATTITATWLGSAELGTGSGVGYQNGYITPGPGSILGGTSVTAHVGIGGDSFSATPSGAAGLPSGKFDAWCVDIYHWLHTPSTFTGTTAGSLASALTALRPGAPDGTTRVTDLIKLADVYYSGLHTQTDSAAFQLAVWAITYGTNGGSGYQINDSDSNFHVDHDTAISAAGVKANNWLTNFSTATNTANYNIVYLADDPVNTTQDLVVFVKTSGATVPEPGMLALVGVGLLAAAAFGRRKQS